MRSATIIGWWYGSDTTPVPRRMCLVRAAAFGRFTQRERGAGGRVRLSAAGGFAEFVLPALFEGLTGYHPQTLEPIAALASRELNVPARHSSAIASARLRR